VEVPFHRALRDVANVRAGIAEGGRDFGQDAGPILAHGSYHNSRPGARGFWHVG